jgi:predicted MFS family arabinose efflux permease
VINRNFTLLWISQATSDVAGEMTSLALPLAVLAATRSPVDAALVATVVAIAQLIGRLPSGLISDTYDRKRLMLLCDAGRGVIALLLACALATGHLTTVVAVGAAAATALFSSVFGPAEAGVLRQSVPPEQRREAITRNVVRSNAAIAIGPPIGGLLLAAGAPLAFLVDAVTYALSLAMVSRVVYRHVPRPRATARGTHPLRATATELTLGFGWLFRRGGLVVLTAFAAYVNLLGRSIELLAAFGVSHDGAHPVSAGLVLTAAGVGGIAGGLCTGRILRRLSPAAVLGTASGAWLLLMPLASSANPLVSAVAVGLVVFSLPAVASLVFLTISVEAPAHLQGRISGAVTLLAISIAWAGPGVTGLLIAAAGPLTTSVVLVAPMAIPLSAVICSRRLRVALGALGTVPSPDPTPAPAAPAPAPPPAGGVRAEQAGDGNGEAWALEPGEDVRLDELDEDVMAHAFGTTADDPGTTVVLPPAAPVPAAIGPVTALATGWGRTRSWL